MIISSPQFGVLSFVPIDPDNLQDPLLHGSEALYYENEFGSILLQQYKNENYSICLTIFKLIKKVTLLIKEETFVLKSQLNLRGSFKVKKAKRSRGRIREEQYILYKSDDEPLTIYFESGSEYHLFNTSFSNAALSELFSAFPSLKEFIDGESGKIDVKKFERIRFASREMRQIVVDLLKCPYDEKLRKLYFENKVNDLLFEMLVNSTASGSIAGGLNEQEYNALHEARKIIMADITKHYSIKSIAVAVDINEFKLKAGFKELFGAGLFEYLLNVRMERARDLILTTDKPMKEIAGLTGFNYLANFVNAFSKHYGRTPGSLRRK